MMGGGGPCVGQSNGHSFWGEDAKKDRVTDSQTVKLWVAVAVASYQGWRADLPPPQKHCWESGDPPSGVSIMSESSELEAEAWLRPHCKPPLSLLITISLMVNSSPSPGGEKTRKRTGLRAPQHPFSQKPPLEESFLDLLCIMDFWQMP